MDEQEDGLPQRLLKFSCSKFILVELALKMEIKAFLFIPQVQVLLLEASFSNTFSLQVHNAFLIRIFVRFKCTIMK